MSKFMSPARQVLAFAAVVTSALVAQAQPVAGELLESYSLGGSSSTTTWTLLTNANSRYATTSSNNLSNWQNASIGNRRLLDDTGTVDLRVLLGGYPTSGFGVYAWSNDLGLEVPATAGFDIQSVVLQVQQIGNPDFYDPAVSPVVGMPDDLLFFNDPFGVYPSGHAYNSGLDALVSTGRSSYAGGPVLRYNTGSGVTVLQADPTVAALVNAEPDSVFGGNWFNFVYQFDLSAVGGTVSWVQVSKPSVVHESTTAVRISVGSSYTAITP